MLESIQGFSWLWVPITLFAALAQTVRNTAQRSLTQELGALSATLVRFLYGLPFAMLWLALLYLIPAKPYAVPSITPIYLGWIALGAFFQLAGTVALLLAMKERNFAVAVTLTKTEVLQLALFASVFLHELPTPLALAAMIVATIGMLLLSLPPRDQLLSLSAWLNRSALYGLACGSCFAVATVGFRGGSLALGAETAWLSGAWGVLIAQSMQTVGMGLWIQLRTAQGLAPIFRAWRISLLAGCMGAAASITWVTADAMQGASPVRTLGMIEVVFSYLVSRRVFSESFSRAEKIGMGLMLLGLVVTCLQA
jgi:drug/metabolite transporter (DMT)-like permease